jgi:hypothetical protein
MIYMMKRVKAVLLPCSETLSGTVAHTETSHSIFIFHPSISSSDYSEKARRPSRRNLAPLEAIVPIFCSQDDHLDAPIRLGVVLILLRARLLPFRAG